MRGASAAVLVLALCGAGGIAEGQLVPARGIPWDLRDEAPPRGLRLLEDALRVPFGDGWGGEARFGVPLSRRWSASLFMRGWAEGLCDPASCPDRALQLGVEASYQVAPRLDLGVGLGIGRSGLPESGATAVTRLRLRF